MLEWTGERYLPWIRQATIAYEHLHRYAYAATLVDNKRVLDLASGEGYGSKMLSTTAANVVGIDLNEEAVRHAREKYAGPNLEFLIGSVTAVPIAEPHSFDVIVCFEAIEHIDDQEKLLSEVKRLLKPDGCFVVSTPNKAVYHDESTEENPFHVKELYFDDLQRLLSAHFQNVRFLGQRIHPASSIWPLSMPSAERFHEFVIQDAASEFQFITSENRVALYYIAIASNAPDTSRPAGSVLIDESDVVFVEKDAVTRWREQQATDSQRQAVERQGRIVEHEHQLVERDQQILEREGRIAGLEALVKSKDSEICELADQQKQLEQGLEETRSLAGTQQTTIESQQQELQSRERQINDLNAEMQRQTESLQSELDKAQSQLASVRKALDSVQESLIWRLRETLWNAWTRITKRATPPE